MPRANASAASRLYISWLSSTRTVTEASHFTYHRMAEEKKSIPGLICGELRGQLRGILNLFVSRF
jgi:hypothetical protein